MEETAERRARLLEWYRANRRDLPWRRTRDPYAIWVSEVMLQQTRVDTVVPYYERFLARWPTVESLAAAPREEVRAAWSGLGYYRRLELMLRAAEAVVQEHRGRLPDDERALLSLPGFGRYTAGAVASIAHDRPAPAVDGNVARVLARVFAIPGDAMTGAAHAAIWARAAELAPGEAPGELTQALIELGALRCTPRAPRCGECPIAAGCRARLEGLVEAIPAPRRRPARSRVELTSILSLTDEGVLLERQPEGGLFASLWLLPSLPGRMEGAELADAVESRLGARPSRIELAAELTHVLTHRELALRVFRVEAALSTCAPPLARVRLDALDGLGLPSITARALKAALPRSVTAKATLPGRRTRRSTDPAQLEFEAPTRELDRRR
jgi:A/G-specific adenine glycosylase